MKYLKKTMMISAIGLMMLALSGCEYIAIAAGVGAAVGVGTLLVGQSVSKSSEKTKEAPTTKETKQSSTSETASS